MMKDKLCLVTGGTGGIGRAAVLELAEMGAHVVVVARNEQKASELCAGHDNMEYLLADLFSLSQIRALGQAFLERYQKLDVLINNAGANFATRELTVDGYERTFALNHLAPFLLTELLSDVLKKTEGARVVTVSSGAHNGARAHLDDLQFEQRRFWWGWSAYCESKLSNLLFTYELARRLEGTGVTATAMHPGFVKTGFARNNGPVLNAAVGLAGALFGRTPEHGAETVVWAASAKELDGVTGKYFMDKAALSSSRESYDEGLQSRLWELSESLVGLP
ncbi:MAG: SDR family oxidoreductase [Proteobacteria bacterium]|jgi:NAD(P)-dependent dehydrogenase (short-subunit alcohol dehydrogenase family)|nr:SDR family oxidoreductase [Pseudomonadota bacterium]